MKKLLLGLFLMFCFTSGCFTTEVATHEQHKEQQIKLLTMSFDKDNGYTVYSVPEGWHVVDIRYLNVWSGGSHHYDRFICVVVFERN